MQEHPFPGSPLPVTPTVTKPTTSITPQTLTRTAIMGGSSLSTLPPTPSDSCTALVGSPYSDPLKKWIVVDHDGAETWLSDRNRAWDWFMVSTFAVRIYILIGGVRSLLGGLPYSPKPWHPNSLPHPFTPKIGATIACYTQNTICIGVCKFKQCYIRGRDIDAEFLESGWRFYPNQTIPEFTGTHKPGVKFHPTYKACIPAWATPLITKWVLVE